MTLRERFKRGWSAFAGRDPTINDNYYYSYGQSYRPDLPLLTTNDYRAAVNAIYNRIAVDVAGINIRAVQLDDEGRYKSNLDNPLNERFDLSANIDQTGYEFMIDVVMSMFDEGCVAVVPVDMDTNPDDVDNYIINELRTGKITSWFPYVVEVDIYNERAGRRQRVIVEKKWTAIIQNPFFYSMNKPNSTAQRLIRVLNDLDRVNALTGQGKLDLIVQLPYPIRNEKRKDEAKVRRDDIAAQLSDSKGLGIAYTDVNEKIVQLNRPLENNLWQQADSLFSKLISELGLTESILNGTADDSTMTNYYSRTVEPILDCLTKEFERKWLSSTARSRKEAIRYYRDPFKLVPLSQIAKMADTFTRNEILTSNEIRSGMGMKPSDDPRANQLINSNLSHTKNDNRISSGNIDDDSY